MNKQRKHYFTSFLSFFQISAEETGRNCFFQAEKTVEKKHGFFRFVRNWRTLMTILIVFFFFFF